MNVDIHLHAIPEHFLEILRRGDVPGLSLQLDTNERGEGWITLGTSTWSRKFPVDPTWFDPRVMMRDIDRMQLDVVALSVLPSLNFHWMPPEVGEAGCRAVNDGLAEMVRARPDRFVGVANVPLQDVSRAVAELDRAIQGLGFRAVQIPSQVDGKNLDEPEFLPFFQKCQELDIPILIHPFFTATGDPSNSGRLDRYYLINYIGNPVETTIAAASLIFGGVLERVPNLKVILSHGGGVLPWLIGRFDHGFAVREESKVHLQRRPSEYFERLYFDTITHSPEVLAFLVGFVGPERVVLGTDYPADMGNSEPVARIRALPISRADRRRILGGNLQKLLRLA